MRAQNIAALVFFIASLSGCSTLPHSGPSASVVQNGSQDVHLINVSPVMAKMMWEKQYRKTIKDENESLSKLALWSKNIVSPRKIKVGSKINVVLWTQSLHLFGSSNGSGGSVHLQRLGTFRINHSGDADIPYLGLVHLSGETLPEASRKLSLGYQKTARFIDPIVQIQWAKDGYSNGILITGNVVHSGFISWHQGGLSLEKILANAGVQSGAIMSGKQKSSYPVIVSVFYQGNHVELPIASLLSKQIESAPGERLLVQQSALGKVTVLGGGILHSGVFSFGRSVDLAQVLADAGGLNPETANDRAIFVLRNHESRESTLYCLRWNNAAGLLASERFPIDNNDVVYVSVSPVVPVEKAVQIFSGFLLPPALLGNAIK